MLEIAIEILKFLIVVFGIIFVSGLISSIITLPLRKKKQQEAVNTFVEELQRIADECIKEIEKQEQANNNNKKVVKKRKNVKKNEDK